MERKNLNCKFHPIHLNLLDSHRGTTPRNFFLLTLCPSCWVCGLGRTLSPGITAHQVSALCTVLTLGVCTLHTDDLIDGGLDSPSEHVWVRQPLEVEPQVHLSPDPNHLQPPTPLSALTLGVKGLGFKRLTIWLRGEDELHKSHFLLCALGILIGAS